MNGFGEALKKCKGGNADERSIVRLLKSDKEESGQLFREAVEVRNKEMGKAAHVRGVIEFANHCRGSCAYCGMRKGNRHLNRYEMEPEGILKAAKSMQETGVVKTVFLQSGESPRAIRILKVAIPKIRKETALDVLLCCGEFDKETYEQLKECGASGYVLKFETSNAALYGNLRPHSTLEKRLDSIRRLKETGFKVGTGNICGLPGQTLGDIARDLLLIEKLGADFASTCPFIPSCGTPLEHFSMGSGFLTLKAMALLRILNGNALIPTTSALENEGIGQLAGFMAGANVITVNFTPPECRDAYTIYSKNRKIVTIEHALDVIRAAGLEIA